MLCSPVIQNFCLSLSCLSFCLIFTLTFCSEQDSSIVQSFRFISISSGTMPHSNREVLVIKQSKVRIRLAVSGCLRMWTPFSALTKHVLDMKWHIWSDIALNSWHFLLLKHGPFVLFPCAMCPSCLLSNPTHFVTWLLVHLPHLCLPHYPPHLLPIYTPCVCKPVPVCWQMFPVYTLPVPVLPTNQVASLFPLRGKYKPYFLLRLSPIVSMQW